jgi:hypothetical protein
MELKMPKANLKWTFSIENIQKLGVNPRSGLHTFSVSGIAVDPEDNPSNFVATNNLDFRYPDRFKVNWNGNAPRMPKPTGHGLEEDVKSAAHSPREGFLLSRGARIAIARQCRLLIPAEKQLPFVEKFDTMNVKELKDLCRERGVSGHSAKGVRKADLVDLLSK